MGGVVRSGCVDGAWVGLSEMCVDGVWVGLSEVCVLTGHGWDCQKWVC